MDWQRICAAYRPFLAQSDGLRACLAHHMPASSKLPMPGTRIDEFAEQVVAWSITQRDGSRSVATIGATLPEASPQFAQEKTVALKVDSEGAGGDPS